MALSQIFSLVPVWHPTSHGGSIYTPPSFPGPLRAAEFPNFSVQELVSRGNLLLASSGKEFVKPAGILSSTQEVKKARKDAMSRLGLGFLDTVEDDMDLDKEFAADMNVDLAENVTNFLSPPDGAVEPSPMDVCPSENLPTKETPPSTRSTTPTLPSPPNLPIESDPAMLSARERNRLKRKRKPGNSAFVVPPPQTAGARYAAAASGTSNKYVSKMKKKKRKVLRYCRARLINAEDRTAPNSRLGSPSLSAAVEKVVIDPSKGGAISPKITSQSKALQVDSDVWIWDGVVKVLEVDLFSAAWEVRHGAAMGLRELLKLQGRCGGMRGGSGAFIMSLVLINFLSYCR